jgi:AcrR family transcriptional regulator
MSPSSSGPNARTDAAMPQPGRRPSARRATAGRPRTLSAQAIVTAAIEVLDDGGVAGLSMRSVAQRLGTGAASLYAYVSSKDELLELIFDELIGTIPLPTPDPTRWREQIVEMMTDLQRVLVSHRDAALAGIGRVPTSAKALAGAETLAAVMAAGRLEPRIIALGSDQMFLYVCAFAFEQGIYVNSDRSPEEIAEYFHGVHQFMAALPAERYPTMASISSEMTGHDGPARFAFGLDILISGLEAASNRLVGATKTRRP